MKLPNPKIAAMLFMLLLMASCTVMVQPPVMCDKHMSGDIIVDKVFRDCQNNFTSGALFK